ncbi:hypothetical protein TNCV_5058711 [Trichonephila clavipes]|nr:hypothetical protein TNCV_5058711 [Trichonephila clavipes]
MSDQVPRMSCSFEHHTGDSMIWHGRAPILRENTLDVITGEGALFPFRQPHDRICGSTTPCRKGNIHLRTSMPSPGFEPRPNVTHHSTGWATNEDQPCRLS